MELLKKLLTLLFAAAAMVAPAATNSQNIAKLQPTRVNPNIEMQATKGDPYTRILSTTKDFTSGTDTMYLTPKGTFFSSYFPNNGSLYFSYNMAIIPTNVEITWTNISTGIASDNYDWVLFNPAMDEENLSIVEGQKDLAATFPNYSGWWVSPRLMADGYNDADYEAGNYYAFDGAVQFGGKFENDVNGDGSSMTGMYQFSPRAKYNTTMRTQFGAGYGEDANAFYTDLPDAYKVEGSDDGKIVNFIQYFDYPGHPYTFSRIQFYAMVKATAGQTLTAKVCRVNDNVPDLDNPIAEAVYEFAADDLGEEAKALDFYFKNDGKEQWLTIDGEIAIVIEGVNELESISPLLNAMTREADLAHDEFYSHFLNGYALWEFYSAGEVIDTRIIPCHMGYYWGSGDDSSLPENLLLSINAQMAYIETVAESATEYTIPATGGNVTLKLKASEPYDAWAVEDIPSWITINAVDQMDEEDGSYTGYTTLTITAEAGHEGEVVYTLPGTEFKIIVDGFILVPGDVNSDGSITIADYVATASYILEHNPQPFVFSAADIDNNNIIDVDDLVGIAYLVLHDETDLLAAPSVEMPDAAHITLDAAVKNQNGCYEIALNMSNNIPLTAMQMDLALPEGMTLIDASLSDRANASHQLDFNLLKNGSYRLLASSPMIKSFYGNDGTVLTLTVAGEPMGQSRLTDIKFVAPNLTSYSIDDVEFNFTPTAIENIYSDASIYNDSGNIIIMAPADGKAQIIQLNGASTTVNVVKGKNVYPAPASGIVIVKMNGEVKKLKL